MNRSRVIAFVVASMLSTVSVAGAQVAAPGSARAAHPGRSAEGARPREGLLRGVTLNHAERTRLKEIRGEHRAEARGLRESLKPAMQEARAARQKGDTAAARAVMARTAKDRAALRALQTRQRAEVRSVLSPDNQRQFDANVQQAGRHRTAAAKKGRGSRTRRHGDRLSNG